VKDSYVLAFGELGEFREFTTVKFTVFVLFTFFIPLLLMNMLIAIMSDAYERVQSNAAAADARQLADMQLEYEEIVYYF
jgi:F0F1-type ATP synthase membrane subunit b/b'